MEGMLSFKDTLSSQTHVSQAARHTCRKGTHPRENQKMIPAYVEKGNRPAEDSSPVRTSEERKRSEGVKRAVKACIFRQGQEGGGGH